MLINGNTHMVLPDDKLAYAVLIDHWCGDVATTTQGDLLEMSYFNVHLAGAVAS
jgi:hypothetical protein